MMSSDDMVVDKHSIVSDEHLASLLDSCAMFFSFCYLDTMCRKYYYIFKHVDFLRDLVGKVEASDICASLFLFLKSSDIDELSTSFLKVVVV